MTFRLLLFVTAIASLEPGPSVASDYWLLSMAEHYTSWDFIDASSVRPNGDGSTRAWITSVVTGPGLSKFPFRYELKEEEFSCTQQQMAVVQDISYSESGSVVSSQQYAASQKRDVIPGSWGAEELKFICGTPSSRVKNKDWIRITASPVVFSDNSYKTYSAMFCTPERTRNCIVP